MSNELVFFDARPLYEWLSLRDTNQSLEEAQALVVLGANCDEPIKQATRIAKDNAGIPIFFTSLGSYYGGNVIFGELEKTFYQKYLKENGIDEARINCPTGDEGSTNTLEEALMGMELICNVVGQVPGKVILVSRPVHQRRTWATFAKHFPATKFVNMPASEPLTYELLPRIVGEYARLIEYAKQGNLLEIDIPTPLLDQAEQLNNILPKAQQVNLPWLD